MTLKIETFVVMNSRTGEQDVVEAPCKDAARELYKDIHPHVKRGAIYVRGLTDIEKENGGPLLLKNH